MNDLIRYLADIGMGKTLYDVFFALGFVSVMTGLICWGRKLNFPLWKTIVLVLIVYPVVVLWMFVMYWIESGFTSWGGNNIVRIFVYVPLAGIPVAHGCAHVHTSHVRRGDAQDIFKEQRPEVRPFLGERNILFVTSAVAVLFVACAFDSFYAASGEQEQLPDIG